MKCTFFKNIETLCPWGVTDGKLAVTEAIESSLNLRFEVTQSKNLNLEFEVMIFVPMEFTALIFF